MPLDDILIHSVKGFLDHEEGLAGNIQTSFSGVKRDTGGRKGGRKHTNKTYERRAESQIVWVVIPRE